MLELIKAWWAERKARRAAADFKAGYEWATNELMIGTKGSDLETMLYDPWHGNKDLFSQGAYAAIADWEASETVAEKLLNRLENL